jgi:hypothetical protein
MVPMDQLSYNKVAKVDTALGLVFGWGIICKQDGKDYFDLQGDHIPEDAMLEAVTEFMVEGGAAKEMHQGVVKGRILFAFPLTTDVAKAFGLETTQTGLMLALKPDSPEMLEKFRTGEYTGFSIGGKRILDEPVEESA